MKSANSQQRLNPPSPQRAPSMKVAVVCMLTVAAVVVALGVGHVSRRQQVIRLGYQLSEARAQLREAQEEDRKLRLERSVLTNPQRIQELAAALGMRRPAEGDVRVVRTPASTLASNIDSKLAGLTVPAALADSRVPE